MSLLLTSISELLGEKSLKISALDVACYLAWEVSCILICPKRCLAPAFGSGVRQGKRSQELGQLQKVTEA